MDGQGNWKDPVAKQYQDPNTSGILGDPLKPTNPKDALGTTRVPLERVSDVANAEESLALTEGGVKYGLYNYRAIGVRTSIYLAAAKRHLAKYAAGEDRDKRTGVHHLGSVRACMGIILEAEAMGKLDDDRGPAIPGFSEWLDRMEERVKHLHREFRDYHPHHWTQKDMTSLGQERISDAQEKQETIRKIEEVLRERDQEIRSAKQANPFIAPGTSPIQPENWPRNETQEFTKGQPIPARPCR